MIFMCDERYKNYREGPNLPWPMFNTIFRHKQTLDVQTIAATVTFGLLRKEKWLEQRTRETANEQRSGNDYLVCGPVLFYTVGMPHSLLSVIVHGREKIWSIYYFWEKFHRQARRKNDLLICERRSETVSSIPF